MPKINLGPYLRVKLMDGMFSGEKFFHFENLDGEGCCGWVTEAMLLVETKLCEIKILKMDGKKALIRFPGEIIGKTRNQYVSRGAIEWH